MSWAHLSAIVWLRSRLALNQLKKGGPLGAVLTIIVLVSGVLAAVISFGIGLGVGIVALPEAEPDQIMVAWDAIVAGFLLFWVIGVVTELQRTEALSLEKLLHLPISPRGGFLLNYASSLVSLALIVFAPGMIGFAIASMIVLGPGMLVVLPLALSMLIAITAVTYQFRGWLAALMVNKRRRGTIIAVVTLGLILIGQLPNLLVLGSRGSWRDDEEVAKAAVERMRGAGEIEETEAAEMVAMNEQRQAARQTRRTRERRGRLETIETINLVLPPGWLPLGARAAAVGNPWAGVLGSSALLAIGVVSLGRSYRTTLRIYTGEHQARRRRKKARAKKEARPRDADRVRWLERRIPGVPEQAAAVALAAVRALMRAPQAKMILLTPIILLVLFGGLALAGRNAEIPPQATPAIALGVVAMTMVCLIQLLQNQFGLDRDGFRAMVLSGAPRREILLGKNLSLVPFAVGIGAAGMGALLVLAPMSLAHLAASLVQLVCVFLICCMVGNVISIYVPLAVSATSMKPIQPKTAVVLKQVFLTLLFPLAMVPSAVPLGVELLLDLGEMRGGVPVYLLLSLVELVALLWIYGRVLGAEGRLLQSREQKVLDDVTTRAE